MRCALLALLATGCATPPSAPPEVAAPAQPTFAIQLHRPSVIGDVQRRRTTMTLTQSTLVTSGETVLDQQAEEVSVTFVANEKTLDIDARGIPTRTEYVVEEAFAETPAGRVELLAPPAVLLVIRGVEEPLVLTEGKLTGEAEELLGLLFDTGTPGRTDDEVFGIAEPQPVGGRWPIQAEVAARDLSATGVSVDPAALTGELELAGVETTSRGDCLRVSGRMVANPFQPAVPPGGRVEKARMEATFVGLFPIDPTQPRVSDSSEMSAEIVVIRTVEDSPVQTETVMRRKLSNDYSEIPAGI